MLDRHIFMVTLITPDFIIRMKAQVMIGEGQLLILQIPGSCFI